MKLFRRTKKINYSAPIYNLEYIHYKNKVYNLILDGECNIFIDTNILTRLYRIYKGARKELLDWIDEYKKIHIPWWAYNEYIKYSKTKNNLKQLSPYKLETLYKQVEEQRSQLMLSISEDELTGSKFTTEEDFFSEIDTILKKIDGLKKVVNKINNSDEVTSEISQLFNDKILKKPDFLNNIENEFKIRLENKIPPGFDESKKENVIGDYIIFKEIQSYCNDNNIKSAIFVTEDKKKDWSYLPENIIFNGEKYSNNKKTNIKELNLPIRIADPRIVNEVKNNDPDKNFFIIDLTLLVSILKEIDDKKFSMISKCLIQQNIIDLSGKDSKGNKEETSSTKLNSSSYSDDVIKDITYNYHSGSSQINEIIKKLKSYNWYTQAEAILHIQSDSFKKEDFDKDDLFIIGRNIYQAACGSERNAESFIENIKKEIVRFKENDGENHVLNGILFEIYFNNEGKIRKRLKDKYIFKVLEIYTLYNKSFEFINQALEKHIDRFLYIPPTKINEITFELQIDDNKLEGDNDKYNYISGIIYNGENLLKIKEDKAELELKWSHITDNIFELLYIFRTESSLKSSLSKALYIPIDKVKVNYNKDKKELFPLCTRDNLDINIEVNIFKYLQN